MVTENEKKNRLNKLDSFLLWVASLSGVGFSVFIAYFELAWAPYAPIFFLIFYALAIGYLKGAVFFDSFTERIRGWNYLLLGLITYISFISFYFNNQYIEKILPGYSLLIQTIVIVIIIVIFILITVKRTTPWLYNNFDEPLCKVTRTILRRSMSASVLLGAILYLFAIILSVTNPDSSLVIYIVTALLLIVPIAIEEDRIHKLLPLEKYYKYVEVEPLENRKYEKIFLNLLIITEVLFLVVLNLPLKIPLEILLVLIALFISSFIGYICGLFYRDRGDLIKEEVDIARSELSPDELAKLRQLIIKTNTEGFLFRWNRRDSNQTEG